MPVVRDSIQIGTLLCHRGRSSDFQAIQLVAVFLTAPASQPVSEPVRVSGAFVPDYRCGAVPDLHRIPFFNAPFEAYRSAFESLSRPQAGHTMGA